MVPDTFFFLVMASTFFAHSTSSDVDVTIGFLFSGTEPLSKAVVDIALDFVTQQFAGVTLKPVFRDPGTNSKTLFGNMKDFFTNGAYAVLGPTSQHCKTPAFDSIMSTASAFDLAIVSYSCRGEILSDKTLLTFPTFARTAHPHSALVPAVSAVFRHFAWRHAAVIAEAPVAARLTAAHHLCTELGAAGVTTTLVHTAAARTLLDAALLELRGVMTIIRAPTTSQQQFLLNCTPSFFLHPPRQPKMQNHIGQAAACEWRFSASAPPPWRHFSSARTSCACTRRALGRGSPWTLCRSR